MGVDLRIKALLWRDRILEVYRNTGLQGEALDLFAALTLGEKSGLSDELKDIYAESVSVMCWLCLACILAFW